ncbi:MAG: helix-turn-helix domain-containing protein [Candidatus Aminicenantes bacterium]|jgi:transposase
MPQMLLPMFPSEATSINPLLGFSRKDDMVYYFNGMMPIFCHAVTDLNSFRLITSQLVVNGVASQRDIVDAFGVSRISVKRYVKIYRQEGASGFFKPRKGRGSAVLIPKVLEKIQGYLNEGRSVVSICDEMNLKADTVNKAIRDGRLHRVKVVDVEKKTPLAD